MSMEGINAAYAVGVTGRDADGTGKPTGSSAPEPPDPDLGSLLTEPTRPPDSESALPVRKPQGPAQNPFLRPAKAAEAAMPRDPDRDAQRAERRDPTRQPDRSSDSALRQRAEPRPFSLGVAAVGDDRRSGK
jgi:hypothetical protein